MTRHSSRRERRNTSADRRMPCELKVQRRPPFQTLRLVQELQPGLRRRAVALAAARGTQERQCFPMTFRRHDRAGWWSRFRSLRSNSFPPFGRCSGRARKCCPRELHFLLRHPVEKQRQTTFRHPDHQRDRADHVRAFVTMRKAEPLVERHRLEETVSASTTCAWPW